MNKETLDLSILRKAPELTEEVVIEIEPLAPLSMVNELPGSYYKTLDSPSKKILSAVFENVLEWHIDLADRKEIQREIRKIRKNQNLPFPETTGSSYIPLLLEYFEITLEIIPSLLHHDDYWSKAHRRADAIVHPKGTFNLSYEIIPTKRSLPRNDKKPAQTDDKALEVFFKERRNEYPFYYSTPTRREYITVDGKYIIKTKMDTLLLQNLQSALSTSNLSYLGTSEGWVDLKLYEL